MSARAEGVLAVYEYLDCAVDAVKALKAQNIKDITVTSSIPHHEIEEILDEPLSPVRFFVLCGGAVGFVTALSLTILTAQHWGIVVGGKAMASLPPYMIIAFELTVLFGSLCNFLSMIGLGGLPNYNQPEPYDPRFSEDRIGIWVPCGRDKATQVEALLRQAGAEEVRVEAR